MSVGEDPPVCFEMIPFHLTSGSQKIVLCDSLPAIFFHNVTVDSRKTNSFIFPPVSPQILQFAFARGFKHAARLALFSIIVLLRSPSLLWISPSPTRVTLTEPRGWQWFRNRRLRDHCAQLRSTNHRLATTLRSKTEFRRSNICGHEMAKHTGNYAKSGSFN